MLSLKKILNSPSASVPTTGKSRNSCLTATTPTPTVTLSTTTPTLPPAPTTNLSTTAAPAHTAAGTNSGFRCRSRLHFFKEDKNSYFSSSFSLSSRKKALCIVFVIRNVSAFWNGVLNESLILVFFTEKLRGDLTCLRL
jgi:hypothetical protein